MKLSIVISFAVIMIAFFTVLAPTAYAGADTTKVNGYKFYGDSSVTYDTVYSHMTTDHAPFNSGSLSQLYGFTMTSVTDPGPGHHVGLFWEKDFASTYQT